MPEEAVAAPSTETSSAAPSGLTGIDALMANMDAAHADMTTGKPPTKASAPPTEAKAAPAAPVTPVAPKVEEKATEKVVEPRGDEEPDWTKAPPKWYKIYEQHKAKTGETVKSLEAKIKALETKPDEQAGDAKKLEAYERQLEELRGETTKYKQQIASLDYTKSDEYKRQYAEPANRVYAEAIALVQRLKVNDGDASRPAVQADFDYIRSLPVEQRRKAATELFGDYAADVVDYTRDIDRIKRDANGAVERHSQEHERTALEREGMTKRQAQEYENLRKSSLENMRANETWGKWFREDPADPEGSKLLADSFSEIEKITSQLDKLPMDQQAAYGAFYHASAAAAPRLMLEVNRLTSKLSAMTAELEKIRGTDPGAVGQQAASPPGDASKPKGIDGALAAFDNLR